MESLQAHASVVSNDSCRLEGWAAGGMYEAGGSPQRSGLRKAALSVGWTLERVKGAVGLTARQWGGKEP